MNKSKIGWIFPLLVSGMLICLCGADILNLKDIKNGKKKVMEKANNNLKINKIHLTLRKSQEQATALYFETAKLHNNLSELQKGISSFTYIEDHIALQLKGAKAFVHISGEQKILLLNVLLVLQKVTERSKYTDFLVENTLKENLQIEKNTKNSKHAMIEICGKMEEVAKNTNKLCQLMDVSLREMKMIKDGLPKGLPF